MSPITNQDKFLEICCLINRHKIVAIDTEFVRENTYLPILCLIQINVDGKCYVVDVLADIDLRPFFKIINNAKIIKIFHSSRQDMEVFCQNFPDQIFPQSIIDTQIMSALCGLGLTISYRNLVKKLFDKDIDKGWQRSDWQARPLHKDQIEYARMDVFYLLDIYFILKDRLKKGKKLLWVKEEIQSLIKKVKDDNLSKNFSLVNRSLFYQENVRLLVNWRDEVARQNNIPRSFVIKDNLLGKIAFFSPKNIAQLEEYNFKTRVRRRNIKLEIIRLLSKRDRTRDKQKPKIDFRLSAKEKIIYEQSKILLRKQAKKYQMNPELIINQLNLQHIISGQKSISDLLFSWRYVVFGRKLAKLLNIGFFGRVVIAIKARINNG